MMEQENGVSLGGEFYSLENPRIKITDNRLIKDLTGLSMTEFAEAWERGEYEAMLALLAVQIARQHPEWRREDVIRFLDQYDMDELKEILPARVDDQPDPPAQEETVPQPLSSTKSSTSNSKQGSSSDSSTPKIIGPQESAGGPEELSRLTA